ncbi:MAG: NusG domain II-containing protein [Sideroxydans sp.]|nr:NusG domain II-containing protein [Sideroxydans sp.]
MQHLKFGDILLIMVAAFGIVLLSLKIWSGAAAERAVIRSGGKIFLDVSLAKDQQISVPGHLGISIVSIVKHRARISSDPSPRQYCVRQGWLQQAGEIALCLPNQVSVELVGRDKKYDSLSY